MTQDIRDLIAEAREALDYSDDTGWFWVGRLADALEASIGERDAALAELAKSDSAFRSLKERTGKADSERIEMARAIERVRDEHQPCYTCAEPHCFRCREAKWPCATFRALDGAPEPEWEYAAGYISLDGKPYPFENRGYLRIVAEADREEYGSSETILVRRRKAGPWLPVEGESSEPN